MLFQRWVEYMVLLCARLQEKKYGAWMLERVLGPLLAERTKSLSKQGLYVLNQLKAGMGAIAPCTDSVPRVTALICLPGDGGEEYAEELSKQTGAVHVSRSIISRVLLGENIQLTQTFTFERRLILYIIQNGGSVILSSDHIFPWARWSLRCFLKQLKVSPPQYVRVFSDPEKTEGRLSRTRSGRGGTKAADTLWTARVKLLPWHYCSGESVEYRPFCGNTQGKWQN